MTSSAALKINKSSVVKIANLVTEWTGNRFQDKHYAMIESRLTRRLLQLSIKNFEDYYAYLIDNIDTEKENLISLLTTHHTYFFRESSHFDFIRDNIIPNIMSKIESRADKKVNILSVACSRGHEVYSLATYLDYNLKKTYPNLKFAITATDVDSQSIEIAQNGVYPFEDLKRVPLQYLEGYWIRGKGDISNFAKIKSDIKLRCEFYTENLLSLSDKTKSRKFDIVLCRNVFIYFDQPKIIEISKSLMSLLTPEGYFIVGISESLRGLNEDIVPVGPSIYRNKNAISEESLKVEKVVSIEEKRAEVSKKSLSTSGVLRILCVDDSSTIHTVLSKILTEKDGFKIVGKAMNGEEAAIFLKSNTVDAITLDIHMPVMTGVEYLEKYFNKNHAPVIMMTSVTRENSDLALRSLTLGASDYVEKPTLHNMKEISQELRDKIKASILNKTQAQTRVFDKQFTKNLTILNPEKCLNVVFSSIGDREKVKELIRQSYDKKIETIVMWSKTKKEESMVISSIFKQWGMEASDLSTDPSAQLKYCCSASELMIYLKLGSRSKEKIVTSVTSQAVESFLESQYEITSKVIIEEAPALNLAKIKRDWNVYPFTSMEYTIFELFAK